jgi:pimeloyl-ACP methyl ester carboxylesterase
MAPKENIGLLILPGMDGTGILLTALGDLLSSRRCVEVVSYPSDKPLGYDELTAFVVEHAPKGQFVILGESFSGPVAIDVAAIERGRVAGLILACSFARSPWPKWIAPIASTIDLNWVPRSIIEAALLGSAAGPELRASLRHVLASLPRGVLRARAAEVLRVDRRNRLREVICPILCLQGRFDRLIGKSALNKMISVQPRARVQWFDAGHMLLETHTDAAAEAINQFCDQLVTSNASVTDSALPHAI